MRRWVAPAVLALAALGCDYHFENPHLGVRGLSEEDLKAPPGKVEIKSAIVNDIRERRALHLVLDEGRPDAPSELKLDKYGKEAVRAKDGYELWRVVVKADAVERVNAVTEIAYWDNELNHYFYHYEGGSPHRDIWLGPFPVKFAKAPADEHEH